MFSYFYSILSFFFISLFLISLTNITGRRSQLDNLRRTTFTATPQIQQTKSPQYSEDSQPQSATHTPRETIRGTSIYSLNSISTYISSHVSFAITRERRYTLSETSNTVTSSLHKEKDGNNNEDEDDENDYEEKFGCITNTSKLLRNSI